MTKRWQFRDDRRCPELVCSFLWWQKQRWSFIGVLDGHWTSAVSIYVIWMEWESIPEIRRWWWRRERSMTSRKEFLCIPHLIECLCYLSLVIWSSAFLSPFSESVVCLSRLGKFCQNSNPEIEFPSPSVTQLPYILSVLTKEVPFCRLSPSWGDR